MIACKRAAAAHICADRMLVWYVDCGSRIESFRHFRNSNSRERGGHRYVHRIVVVDDGEPVGIISSRDLVKLLTCD